MTLIRLFPTLERFEGLSRDDQSWTIAKEYGICNGWRINFAIDAAGNSFGETGSSIDVSTELDRFLLGKLRSLADVIVTSGQTARAEKYRSSKHAPIAIFTKTGDLDVVPAIQGTQYFTPLVITTSWTASELEVELSDVDVQVLPYDTSSDSGSWPASIASVLHHKGFQSPILESGLATLRQFLEHNVIDEICLSVSYPPKSSVSARDLSVANLHKVFGQIDGFELANLFTDGKSTFSRWRRGSHAT